MSDKRPTKQRRTIYVALEEFDFIWAEDDLEKVRELWNNGIHLLDMARYLRRKPIEVFCILLDQSHTGRIEKREGDLHGYISQIAKNGY